ncbi:MAG TPA: hypothetical protein VIE15_07225, partial [Acidimicrobiales bacterium]
MRIPVSCTLSTRQAVQRVAEWRAFLASDVDLVEVADCRARLRLAPSSGDTLAKAADLAQREVACCSFFRFSIDVGHDELWLVVEVDDSSAAS